MGKRIVIDELEFEVPYGKLAAKTWHEETDECKRVIALHGWMDNSGSFDNLIPQLTHKDGLYVVALDLPGHGKSSQLPPGSSYSDLNMVMEIRRCLTELKWIQPTPKKDLNGDGNHILPANINNSDQSGAAGSNLGANSAAGDQPRTAHKKFTIIGHSLGAGLGLFYSSLFPNDVEEIVLIDFLKPKTLPDDVLIHNTANTIDQFISTVPSQSPFSSPLMSKSILASRDTMKQADKGQVIVSQEAAIVATIDAHKQLGALTRDDALCLLKRSTIAVSSPANSVIYSRDLRLNAMLHIREHWDVTKLMFWRTKCHAICLLARSGIYSVDKYFRDKMETMEEFLRTRSQTYHIQWLDGDHFIHLNRPKQTAEAINKYLESPANYKVIE